MSRVENVLGCKSTQQVQKIAKERQCFTLEIDLFDCNALLSVPQLDNSRDCASITKHFSEARAARTEADVKHKFSSLYAARPFRSF